MIDAGKYVYYYFNLPSMDCSFTGQLDTEGDRTFDALLFNEADFNEWTAGREASQTGSGPVSSWAPHIALPQVGAYYLVVRNLLPEEDQTVTIKAQVTCARPSAGGQ